MMDVSSNDVSPIPGTLALEARRELRFAALVLIGGLVLRLIWLQMVHGSLNGFLSAAEAEQVARAFAESGTLADAYFSGQGPTAHLLPVSPAIAGAILWLFGPGSWAANIALLVWSLAQVGLAYWLLWTLFRELDADPRVARWGLAILCLVPAFAPQEVVDFRYWEGGLALALAAANLLMMVRLGRDANPGWRKILLASFLAAFAIFVSPPVGLATGLCWLVMSVRCLPLARTLQLASVGAIMLSLMIGPWMIRNDRALGEPIAFRSNFGLELAVANHEGALGPGAPEYVFSDRMKAIHPAASEAKRALILQPGGEVRYARQTGEEASRWIRNNPISFAKLYFRHLSEFVFPRAWQMYFSGWEGMREGRAWAMTIVNALGLIGLLIALLLRRPGYGLITIYVAAIVLPYAIFQPMPRYIYLVTAMLSFPAVFALVSGAKALSSAMQRNRPL